MAKARVEGKEQRRIRDARPSALASALARRSGRSPALPYPPREQDHCTIKLLRFWLTTHVRAMSQCLRVAAGMGSYLWIVPAIF
jgi:hypothetical protein